jgi:murein DD-endopeptidase MepM/ murein hydrolase activator NlpD
VNLRRRLAVALVVCGVLVLTPPALADDLESDLDRVSQRIDDLADLVESTDAGRSSLADRIVATRARMDELRRGLTAAEETLADVQRDLNLDRLSLDRVQGNLRQAHLELAATRTDIDAARSAARGWARLLYINGGQEIPGVALTAAGISDVPVAIVYLERVAARNEAGVARLLALEQQAARQRTLIEHHEEDVADRIARLEVMEERAAQVRDDLAARTAAIQSEIRAQRAVLAEYDATIAELEGEIALLEREQARIEAAIAAEQDPGGAAPATALARPVPGAVTSSYGLRVHPILGYTRMHTGIDMAAAHGQAIRAAEAGRVILATQYGGYGNTTIIDHGGGIATLYAHQSAFDVVVGDTVARGEVIGAAGSSGLATGAHLHFEVRQWGKPVDPAPYLGL